MTYKAGKTYSEAQLISKAKNGDAQAFNALAELYSRRIYNIGLRMLGDSEDAADMAQEVLIKIYRYLGSFRGESAFSTWVYRISVNSCRDALRNAYRKKEMVFSDFADEQEQTAVFEVEDISAVPENLYLEAEASDYLLGLIQSLNPKYRLVIVLRELSGLSYQEIADAANISIGTVKSRLSRARIALAEKISTAREQYPLSCCLNSEDSSGKEVR
jgi:RNA polymerase sigma-70 factor (ECF subfamily)